jgi:hypothetical protein
MKWRSILGLIASIVIIGSSAAHSFLGWKQLGGSLARGNAPADLIGGIRVGWLWGGAAMLTFGIIALAIFFHRLRGDVVQTFPAAITGVAYVAFGLWALVESGNPFFLIFVIPGVMLVVASR